MKADTYEYLKNCIVCKESNLIKRRFNFCSTSRPLGKLGIEMLKLVNSKGHELFFIDNFSRYCKAVFAENRKKIRIIEELDKIVEEICWPQHRYQISQNNFAKKV